MVLGAGPTGATAARVAAAAGARVCLLERMQLPRYKTCGGGLVGLSLDNVGIDVRPLVRQTVDTLTMTLDGRLMAHRRRRDGQPLLSMVMRPEFDAALVDAARAAGAVVRTGVHVTGLREVDEPVPAQAGGPAGAGASRGPAGGPARGPTRGPARGPARGMVLVDVRGGPPVRARVVVGADGTSGRSGSYVGVTCDQIDVGLEGEFKVSGRLATEWLGRMLLDWGPVPGSYGWVFPKGDVLTVGVIGARQDGEALRRYYRAFVDRLGLTDVPRLHDSGHLTRVRAAGSPLRRGRVLVAGDAAGLLDPWTREGISFALRSGRLAGEAAAAAAAGDEGALARYPERVEAVFGSEMAAGRSLLAVFARRPGLMHTMMTVVPGTFGLFSRIIEGRSTVARQLRRPGVTRAIEALSR